MNNVDAVIESEIIYTLKMENLKLRTENERLKDIIYRVIEKLKEVQILIRPSKDSEEVFEEIVTEIEGE